MTRVLVTGAGGFVGTELCATLARSGYLVRAALRADRPVAEAVAEKCVVGEIGSATDWSAALRGVDVVIHLAARVHVPGDPAANRSLYFETNAAGAGRLAGAAARAGVRRFVGVSSIKVNGEQTTDRPYTDADEPSPADPYAESKRLGELMVLDAAARTGMEVVHVRPPLVYGSGVRANFLRLLRWIDSRRPLPFGSVNNRRSLVSVWNLSDLIVGLVRNPAAPGRTWLVSDGEDLSTPELIRRIGVAMGRPARLLAVPLVPLRIAGALTGSSASIARLLDSLQVDISRTRALLGWTPPLSVEEGLARTVRWYVEAARDPAH